MILLSRDKGKGETSKQKKKKKERYKGEAQRMYSGDSEAAV